MFKKLFVLPHLIKKPQIVTFLAEDEQGMLDSQEQLGKISQSILTQTIFVIILGLILVTYFRGYVPGTYGGLGAYIFVFLIGFIYWRIAIREYRATCTIAMHDIIKEYTHHNFADKRILRKVLDTIYTQGRKSNDFTQELRGLFLKYKKEETQAQAEYDEIIKEANNNE